MSEASTRQIAVLGLLQWVSYSGLMGESLKGISSSDSANAMVWWQHRKLRTHPIFSKLSDDEFRAAQATAKRQWDKVCFKPDERHQNELWAISVHGAGWEVETLELAMEVVLADGEVRGKERQALGALAGVLNIGDDLYKATADRVLRRLRDEN